MTKFSTENALLIFLLAPWIFYTDSFLLNISMLREMGDDAPIPSFLGLQLAVVSMEMQHPTQVQIMPRPSLDIPM